jgi:hypothetical protein
LQSFSSFLSNPFASLNSDINSLMCSLTTWNCKKCVNNFVHRSLSLFRKQSCLCQSSIKWNFFLREKRRSRQCY